MSNSTPPTPPADEQRGARTEAALRERDWIPRRWDSFGGVEDAVTRDGSYSLRIYPAESQDVLREALCRIDDWTREEGDKIPYLWVLDIPHPKDVPDLLAEHPEATRSGVDAPIWDYVVDLRTGKVVAEKEARRLLEEPRPPAPGRFEDWLEGQVDREGLAGAVARFVLEDRERGCWVDAFYHDYYKMRLEKMRQGVVRHVILEHNLSGKSCVVLEQLHREYEEASWRWTRWYCDYMGVDGHIL